MSVVVLTGDLRRVAAVRSSAGDEEVATAHTLRDLSHEMLREDARVVILDLDHAQVDPLEAVRLVKGTRWDVRLVCIGSEENAVRAQRGGATVLPPAAWDALGPALRT